MLPLTPTKLGRYEIVDEIGKGAMGVVYLARDPLIGRLVALKTFRSGYSVRDQEMEQFRVRFIREAQSAGILSHPNIVTIHDVVEESEDGGAFIAMEYVRGTNLKALLQGDQPLSLPFVVDVIAQVADALDYAHSHRVVHRDVKPANILITADNRVKITDFGIARLDTSNLTQEGQLLGTPNYMAPEQIQGKDVDYRADHFALGVVLYEMLTRHKPFQGENLTVVSHRIVYDHFTPPREYMREMPPGIEPILDKALEKDPAHRYQRAKEMVDDLRRVAGALSGGDLNETQSLSMIAPVLVPPVLPPSPDATGAMGSMGSTGSFGSRTPPPLPSAAPVPAMPTMPTPPAPPAIPEAALPPLVKAPKPPSPPRSGPLVSVRRVALAGGAAALLLLLAAAGGFLWLSRTAPARGRSAQEDADHARFITLVQMGSQLLRSGDQMGAANAYREAERLAPKPEKIRRLRLAAEQKANEQGRLVGVEQQKIAYLQSSQQAIESRRWDDAVAAATAGLALDPADASLQQALAAAQTGQNRARERALAAARSAKKGQPEVAATAQPVAPPTLTPRESRPAEPVSHEATLRMTFESELSGAIVIVYAGATKVWQASIADHGGFLHRNRGGGSLDKTVQVPAGSTELKIYVTPPGQAARVKTLSGSFPGGASRTLTIRLPESKEPTVDLR
ncbi:MAG TPA: serine/threonine-protein kinase [Thermoanaerobaculia bacterium]|nr:serine/threonine-protein kinase [Thermoanaerobaculia bacterium]